MKDTQLHVKLHYLKIKVSDSLWILQARMLEWVAFPQGIFPTQGSNPGFDQTSPALHMDSFPAWATREAQQESSSSKFSSQGKKLCVVMNIN